MRRNAVVIALLGAVSQAGLCRDERGEPFPTAAEKILARQNKIDQCGASIAAAVDKRWRRDGLNKFTLDIAEIPIDEVGVDSRAATVIFLNERRGESGIKGPTYAVWKSDHATQWCDLRTAYVVFRGSGLAGTMRAFGPVGE